MLLIEKVDENNERLEKLNLLLNEKPSSLNPDPPAAIKTLDYENNSEGEQLQAKSFSIPTFWKNEPELWFSVVESIFELNGIKSDKMMFTKVLSVLDCGIAKENSNLFQNEKNLSYMSLKSQLIKMYQVSEEEKLRKLFSECELGDKKPSQLYREMTSLASGQMSKKFITLSWLKKLPTTIEQLVRAFQTKLSEEDLVNMADEMFKSNENNSQISSVKHISRHSSVDDRMDMILKKLEEVLGKEKHQSRSPRRYHSKSRNHCYFHRRFKEKAFKCIKPCTFDENTSENSTASR